MGWFIHRAYRYIHTQLLEATGRKCHNWTVEERGQGKETRRVDVVCAETTKTNETPHPTLSGTTTTLRLKFHKCVCK